VHCARTPSGPRVLEVLAVEDTSAADTGRFTTTPLLSRAAPDAPLAWSGLRPERLTARLGPLGLDLAAALRRQERAPC